MNAELQQVLDVVSAEKTDIGSLIALVAGLQSQIAAITTGKLSPEDQAAVDLILANVTANAAEVHQALTANTAPAAPPAQP